LFLTSLLKEGIMTSEPRVIIMGLYYFPAVFEY